MSDDDNNEYEYEFDELLPLIDQIEETKTNGEPDPLLEFEQQVELPFVTDEIGIPIEAGEPTLTTVRDTHKRVIEIHEQSNFPPPPVNVRLGRSSSSISLNTKRKKKKKKKNQQSSLNSFLHENYIVRKGNSEPNLYERLNDSRIRDKTKNASKSLPKLSSNQSPGNKSYTKNRGKKKEVEKTKEKRWQIGLIKSDEGNLSVFLKHSKGTKVYFEANKFNLIVKRTGKKKGDFPIFSMYFHGIEYKCIKNTPFKAYKVVGSKVAEKTSLMCLKTYICEKKTVKKECNSSRVELIWIRIGEDEKYFVLFNSRKCVNEKDCKRCSEEEYNNHNHQKPFRSLIQFDNILDDIESINDINTNESEDKNSIGTTGFFDDENQEVVDVSNGEGNDLDLGKSSNTINLRRNNGLNFKKARTEPLQREIKLLQSRPFIYSKGKESISFSTFEVKAAVPDHTGVGQTELVKLKLVFKEINGEEITLHTHPTNYETKVLFGKKPAHIDSLLFPHLFFNYV